MVSATFEIRIEEFKPWLEKQTANILQPLREQGKKIVDKIKERLDDAHEACEKLAEEGNREIQRGKAVRKARVTEKLSRYFIKQINKVAFPDNMSFSELYKLHKDLEKMFTSIARERNAWFPRISPLFIIARKRADFVFSRLAGSISELGAFLADDYSKAKVVEDLFSKIDEMTKLLDDLDKYEKHKANAKEKLRFLQTKIEENQKTIASIKSSKELGDLTEMNQKIQHLRTQVKHELRHLQKPFIKFANLTRGPEYALSSEEAKKLSQYMKDPFLALATEKPGYPTLRNILKKVEQAMKDKKLKLKSSRLRKGQEEINAILNKNKLDDLHQSCAHIFSLNQQLIASKETQAAQKKSKHLQRKLEELRRQKEVIEVRLDALENEHKQLLEKINKQKKMLEKMVYKILEKPINIKF
jgi:predicted  nucleic acid-binding Zn-ribbon protein